MNTRYTSPHSRELARRLAEWRRFMQVVAGPRQVGKTTLVRQVLDAAGLACVYGYGSADEPTPRGGECIEQQWDAARLKARAAGKRGGVLAVDEIHKIPGVVRDDFVVKAGRTITAIEVKSGRRRDTLRGMEAFGAPFPVTRKLLVGADGGPLEEFLTRPLAHWVRA